MILFKSDHQMDILLVSFVLCLFNLSRFCCSPLWKVYVDDAISLPRQDTDPEVTEGFYEGDIEYRGLRNAVKNYGLLWPNGVVHYKIDLTYSGIAQHTIKEAMREIEHDTAHDGKYCVQFVPLTNERDYIYIRPEKGCHSPVGRHHGEQVVSLGHGCEHKGTVMHELLHTLGFWHEQNRYDRNAYVNIHYDNILKEHWRDFTKHTTQDMSTFGQPYDYRSIMHYGPYTFAKDKSSPSITPNVDIEIGQREQLSRHDVKMIQLLYGCPVDTSHIISPDTKRIYLIDCNFEQGLCNMIQDISREFQYERIVGSALTPGLGPSGDRTDGIGYYLIAYSQGKGNKTAKIFTPRISGGQYYCIRNAYFIQDADGRSSHLDVNIVGDYLHTHTVKSYTSSGNRWMDAYINLNAIHLSTSFQVVFHAHVANNNKSSVAVDDIQVYPGRCVI